MNLSTNMPTINQLLSAPPPHFDSSTTSDNQPRFFIETFTGVLLKAKPKDINNRTLQLQEGSHRIVTLGACIEADGIYVVLEVEKPPKQDTSKLIDSLRVTIN